MDLIQAYGNEEGVDSKSQESSEPLPQPVLKKMHVEVAPLVEVRKQVVFQALWITG